MKLDLAAERLEKHVGALAIESVMAGVVYFVRDGCWGIADLNDHGTLTGSMEMLPYLIEELQGLYDVYGKDYQ
jgi:hypothetical protein